MPTPAQPNSPKAPLAAIPFSTMRREMTSRIVGSVEGLTTSPSLSS